MYWCVPIDSYFPLSILRFNIPAGFPSPAQDYVEEEINLAAALVENPIASYVMRVSGQSMTGAGIFDGDYVVVDRSVTPKRGHIVVATIDGDMTVKRLSEDGGIWTLRAENPDYAPIPVTEGTEIWGVVRSVARKLP